MSIISNKFIILLLALLNIKYLYYVIIKVKCVIKFKWDYTSTSVDQIFVAAQ